MIPWRTVSFGSSFRCPSCGVSVEVPRWYLYFQSVLALIGPALVAYAFGMRGFELALSIIVAFFPAGIIVSSITRRVLPPRLRFSGEFRT